jgi:hypothetical protein
VSLFPGNRGRERGGAPGPRRTPGRSRFARRLLLVAVVGLLTLPLLAHGCHGDDVDHEPGAAPPVRTDLPAAARENSSR